MDILYKDECLVIWEDKDEIIIQQWSGGQCSEIELKKNTNYINMRFHLVEEG